MTLVRWDTTGLLVCEKASEHMWQMTVHADIHCTESRDVSIYPE